MSMRKQVCTGLASGLLLVAASSAHAVPVTYNFSITGVVDALGTKVVKVTDKNGSTTTVTLQANAFGLNVNDTITVSGTFTADLGPTLSGTVAFDSAAFNATGNTFTINLNGTLLNPSDDNVYAGGWPYMTFTNGALFDFDYFKQTAPKFNSSFTYFDDVSSVATVTTSTGSGPNKVTTETTYNAMFGHWDSAVLSPVPEAETYAMMLVGLGLVGWAGATRRKALRAAA